MAAAAFKAVPSRICGLRLGLSGINCPTAALGSATPVTHQQVAHMRATHGEPFGYEKPWPYETKRFRLWSQLFERTIDRFNENTKVIAVEGNIGVGKNEFAKRLAKEFDLKYFPSVDVDAMFISEGFDVRSIDDCLPETARSYDLAKFYSDPNPKKGTIGRLQLYAYIEKYIQYSWALHHMLSTGQGVVVCRSPFGDNVFIEALHRMGYITPSLKKYYYDLRDNSICELHKPHITIYLDAPTTVLQERINKRGDPREVGSAVLNDKYIDAISAAYRERVLPQARENQEVLEIDWTEPMDDMDFDVLVEEMQRLKLEAEDNEDPKFKDYYNVTEDEWSYYRRIYGSAEFMSRNVMRAPPYECPEVLYSQDDAHARSTILFQHPCVKYQRGWAPQLGDSTAFRI